MSEVEFPTPSATPNYRLSLLCVLLIKAAIMIYIILHAGIGLGPDEAQYWTWSTALDWGYYSKPPGIAWQIFLGTYFLGDTELGVRFGSLVIGFLLPWATYYLANRCGLRNATAFWAGTVLALSPLGIVSSFFATTDGGYVLFWTLGMATIVSALRQETVPNYALVGLCILCGALFKWTAYTLWVAVALLAYLYPQLRTKAIIPGVIISLFGMFPSVVWNRQHDWATFRHVWSTNMVGEKGPSLMPFHGNFFDFLGAQIALLSPVFAVLFVLAAILLWKHRENVPIAIAGCGYVSMAIFAFYGFASLFTKIQGNWCVFAHPTATVFLCWFACDWLLSAKSWLLGGTVLSSLLTAFVFSIPNLQANGTFSIPCGANPFKHNLGWRELEKEIRSASYEPDQDFLFSRRYQTTSLLSFYNEGHERAYFMNLDGVRRNQFSYWPDMRVDEIGKNGFFIEIEQARDLMDPSKGKAIMGDLKKYFREVSFVGRKPLLVCNGKLVKAALIFHCIDYNGLVPTEPDKF